ncbi:hypothetical protein ACS0TY_033460 [Phlomoides rotata]
MGGNIQLTYSITHVLAEHGNCLVFHAHMHYVQSLVRIWILKTLYINSTLLICTKWHISIIYMGSAMMHCWVSHYIFLHYHPTLEENQLKAKG